MMAQDTTAAGRLRALGSLGLGQRKELLSSRNTLCERSLDLFPGDTLLERVARALARRRAVPWKEFAEAVEFFARVRKPLRAPIVADLYAGHGLCGALFALYEERVERVLCCDRRRPESAAKVLDAFCEVGPWVRDKVEWRVQNLKREDAALPQGTSVVAIHACGGRTDRAIELGVASGGAIGLMPCCYDHSACGAPPAVSAALGAELATDVDRSYRMTQAGYLVRWDAVAPEITPMNRVMLATMSRS